MVRGTFPVRYRLPHVLHDADLRVSARGHGPPPTPPSTRSEFSHGQEP
ncbi:hypothetical protein SSBG_02532 [Streptomyces sp. SPB074]|nr:hypothetical protein SSBG_02532 [Streptomyces sp. SPB074]